MKFNGFSFVVENRCFSPVFVIRNTVFLPEIAKLVCFCHTTEYCLKVILRHRPKPKQLWIFQIIIHQIFSLARDWFKRDSWLNIPHLKLRSIRVIFSNIFKTARVAKKNICMIIETIASIWSENMSRYFSLDINCSSKLTVLTFEPRSWKTEFFSEQIMSAANIGEFFRTKMLQPKGQPTPRQNHREIDTLNFTTKSNNCISKCYLTGKWRPLRLKVSCLL